MAGRAGLAALTLLVLLLQWGTVQGAAALWGAQDRWVGNAMETYRGQVEALDRDSPCPRITVVESALKEAFAERKELGDWVTAGVDHQTMHRFLFSQEEEKMRRFVFVPSPPAGAGGDACVVYAFGGRLLPSPPAPSGNGGGR